MAMNNRLLRPGASGFTPRSIAGLQLWFDASVQSSVTLNAGNVSQVNDLSGNGRHLVQSTAALQPAYVSAGRNGRNVIDYGATSGKFLIQTLASAFTLAQPITFFWAFKTPASGGWSVSDVTDTGFTGNGRLIADGTSSTQFRFDAVNASAVTVLSDAWTVASCVYNGSASVRRVNTTTGTSVSLSSRSYSNQLVWGANFGWSNSVRSLVGEIGMYSGNLTDSQHSALLLYLAKKWAVTLL